MTIPAYPNQFPALTLDFVNSKKLDPRITFERASAASPDSSAMVNGEVQQFGPNVPRLSDKGLLIEESRTNYQFNSEAFAVNTAWRIKDDYTRGPNTTEPAPDGSNTACEFFEVTGGSILNGVESASMYQVTAASGRLTISVYNKPINCDTFNIMPSTTTSAVANCTSIVNNTWQFNTNFVESAKAEPIGNGWYRMSATMIVPTSAQWYRPLFSSQMFGGPTDTPDSSQGCTLWGAQVEEGGFVSSYIPNTATSTTTVTRAAEVCEIIGTDFSSWWNTSAGTVLTNWYVYDEGVAYQITNNWDKAVQTQVFTPSSGTQDTLVGHGIPTYQENGSNSGLQVDAKNALAFTAGDAGAALNGVLKTGTAATPTIPPSLIRTVFFSRWSGDLPCSGYLKKFTYYPTRLPDTALEVLTT